MDESKYDGLNLDEDTKWAFWESSFSGPFKVDGGKYGFELLDGDVTSHIMFDIESETWSGKLHDYRKDCNGDIEVSEDGSNLIEFIEYVENY